MLEQFNKKQASDTPTNKSICNQAKYFYNKLSPESGFRASSDGLTKFKQRYGIKEVGIQGEKFRADSSAADKFRKVFKEFVAEECKLPEQI